MKAVRTAFAYLNQSKHYCIRLVISAMGIMLYAVLYRLLADAPVHVSLCMWGMWATVAWGTAAARAGKRMHSAYISTSDKQLKVFLALLAVFQSQFCFSARGQQHPPLASPPSSSPPTASSLSFAP